MNTLIRLVVLLVVIACPLSAADSLATFSYAVDAATIATVTAADDERVAATIARDQERLAALLSDELHYAHSNGVVDTRETLVDAITTGRSVYESYDYQDRTFLPAAPGIVLMTGRTIIHSRQEEEPLIIDLNFLAVWRYENGRWRFLAWQSCRNPPPAPAQT